MSVSPLKYITLMKYHIKYVQDLLKQYSKVFTWPKHDSFQIVDIGSGPGHLLDKLEPNFPQHYTEIIGLDKEIDMVNYFNAIPRDRRISAKQFDIESVKVPDDLKKRFDFAFSCCCFQYVKDVRRAFTNSSQLLKTNGESLFIWCRRCHMYDIYKSLSKVEKWSTYTNDFKHWENYFDGENPLKTVEMEFNEVGMEILRSDEHKDFCFEDEKSQYLIELFESLDTISARIPKYDQPKYKEDFQNAVLSQLIMDDHSRNGLKYKLPFPTIVVAAKKN